jgi:hypothetical protein
MSVLILHAWRRRALCGSAVAAVVGFAAGASAQTKLPEIVVTTPKEQSKPKPQQARTAPPPGASARRRSGAGAGQSGRRDGQHPQSGTEHDLCADRHHIDDDQSRHHPGASGRRQSNGRKDPPAGARRDAGFGRQRQFPRAQ